MGKYSHLKDQITKFEVETNYQQELDKIKESTIVPKDSLLEGITASLKAKGNYSKASPKKMSAAQLAAAWVAIREVKDQLEEFGKILGHQLDAIGQVMVAKYEEQDTSSQRFDGLGTFFLKDTPYPSVEDKQKLNEWIKKQKMTDLLGIHHKTLEGMVNERLMNGEDVPPGVKVYMKTTIQRTK